jgi:DNA-directed RNA polymerase subunit RPC12/RpoP
VNGLERPGWWPEERPLYEVVWCTSCERTFTPDQADLSDGGPRCPHCGAAPMYWWDWQELLLSHPLYPRDPKVGGHYPLY